MKKAIDRPEGKLALGYLYLYHESEPLCSQEHNIQKQGQSARKASLEGCPGVMVLRSKSMPYYLSLPINKDYPTL